jgi:hypothetical protein
VAIAVALATPTAVLGAADGVDLPGWMQGMMNGAPPEMERMMRSPEMEQMMRDAGMGQMMEPDAMEAMMRSMGMPAMMHGPSSEPIPGPSR